MIGTSMPTPVFGGRSDAAHATLREIEGRPVSWFEIEGGKRAGAIGVADVIGAASLVLSEKALEKLRERLG